MATQISTLTELLTNSVASYSDNPLFGVRGTDGDWKWTSFGEFGDDVDKARGGLASLGVGHGDRVAAISDNRVEWAVGAYATYSLGAAWVPMYEAQTQKDWVYILRDSGAKVLFAATDGIRAQVEEVAAEIPDLQTIIVIDDPAGGEAIDYTELLARGAENPAPVAVVSPEDLAGLIYTSGTTGDPKGVKLSTVELHVLIYFGASTGLTTAATLIRDMPEVQPTILVSVPTVFNKVYDGLQKRMEAEGGITQTMFNAAISNGRKKIQLEKQGQQNWWVDLQDNLFDKIVFTKVRAAFGGRLRYAFSGGAAISTEVAEFISAVGIVVYEGYGLTETSPIVTCNVKGARRVGSVGRVIPDVTVTIDTDITGDSEIGEIVVHGPNVMMGYYNLPEADAEVFTPDGGFRTGDLGHVDDDGYLYIRGRIKEQYKLENGKYVVPSPIEEQLQLSGFISQVMVYGEQRPYNVAVVVPDIEYLERWASENNMDASDLDALMADEKVQELFGMLTPSLKIKRRAVMAKFGGEIDAMYEADNPLIGRDE